MYKCLRCGNLFEDGEQARGREWSGEPWQGCPICGGDFTEADACEICGAFAEELFGGVCECCIEDCEEDIETCYKIGEKSKDKIELNSFLTEIFTPNDIEDILYDILKDRKSRGEKVDCKKFIESDKDFFGEQLARLKK